MKIKIFIILLLSFNMVQAQNRNELWTKLNVTKKIREPLDVGIDIQHRRQNGFENDNDMLHYGMTSSIRLWTFYKLRNNWSIVLSPIAYFNNQVIKATTKEIQNASELRSMLGLVKAVSFGKLALKNRLLYEVSSIKSKEPQRTIKQRYRLQNAFIFPLKKFSNNSGLNYGVTNEILFKTVSRNTTLDQNRFYNGIQWKGAHNDINLGYQYTFHKEGSTHIDKNQLVIILNFNL